MRPCCGWLFVGLVACTNVSNAPDSGSPPPGPPPVAATPTPPVAATPTPPAPEPNPPTPEPTPTTAPAKLAVTVQMTAVTLGDDCGGGPSAASAKQKGATQMRLDRACEPSSMQLSVVAPAGSTPTQLAVKKVELVDDKGAKIGDLTARAPTVWDQNGTYQAWDQRVAPGTELSVSYQLSQPPWGDVPDRRNRGYVLKAVFTIGDGEQAVQREVESNAPARLPPGVKT